MNNRFWRLPGPLWGRYGSVALGYTAVLWFFRRGLDTADWPHVTAWTAVAGLVAGGQLLFLALHLPRNHPPGQPDRLLPTLGWGNRLSLLRGVLLAVLAGFLVADRPAGALGWLPAVVYTVAAVIDFTDGLAARLSGHITELGAVLDMELDGLGVGVACLLAVLYGQVGVWFLSVAAARYLFIIGTWWRKRHGRPIYDLTDSRYRRLIAGYNMGFLTVLLWPILTPNAAAVGAAVFVPPFLGLFLRDWLVTSGRIRPEQDEWYRRLHGRARAVLDRWLPPAARMVVAITAVSSGLWPRIHLPLLADLLTGWNWPQPHTAATLFSIALLGLLPAVVAGVWARWLALAAVIPVGFYAVALDLGPGWRMDVGALGGALCVIIIFNSGRWSLRRPSEAYMYRPIG